MERHHFETELRELRACVARMGGLVCARLEACLRALSGRDGDAARFVIGHDEEINALQIEIDERALRLLALQQPAAVDLRFITATVKANADLERIGDQAVNVAGTALQVIGRPELEYESVVVEMGGNALSMVKDALASFLDRNARLARSVLERDDEIDAMKRRVLRDLIALMTRDPGTIERAVSLVFISRNFERVADHATNMAEDAIFLVEARDIRHHHESA
jgi:phosphate transport system protein